MDAEDFEEYRMGHLTRTAGVWKRLVELGATEQTPLDFDFAFTATSKASVDAMKAALPDYPIKIEAQGFLKKTYTLSGNTGPIAWTEGQLLKWVDYLLAVGKDADCEFQGCGANAPKRAI